MNEAISEKVLIKILYDYALTNICKKDLTEEEKEWVARECLAISKKFNDGYYAAICDRNLYSMGNRYEDEEEENK